MTRHLDIRPTLRSLDPADHDIDPRGARARTDLARILADDPAGRQQPSELTRSGRPSSVRRTAGKVALAAGTVTAIAAGVVVLPSMTGGDRAYATWTPHPQGMSPQARANAVAGCREAQTDGPGAGYAKQLRGAVAAVAERRGAWTTVRLTAPNGFSALCITDSSTRLFKSWFGSVGVPAGYIAPGPRDLFTTDLGSGSSGAGALSLAAGAAGSEVAKVVYRSQAHGAVAATVSRGSFALWLPGNEMEDASRNGVQVEVTYKDDTTETTRLRL